MTTYLESHQGNLVEYAPQIANVFRYAIPYTALSGFYIFR